MANNVCISYNSLHTTHTHTHKQVAIHIGVYTYAYSYTICIHAPVYIYIHFSYIASYIFIVILIAIIILITSITIKGYCMIMLFQWKVRSWKNRNLQVPHCSVGENKLEQDSSTTIHNNGIASEL